MTETLKKMVITAFSDNEFKEQCGTFTVQINPDSFTRSLSVTWSNGEAINKKNLDSSMPSFNPEKYSFTLYFDGTGATAASNGTVLDVKEAVDGFLNTVYKRTDKKEEEEQFVFVGLSWCGEKFKCVADSVSVNYTLFSPSGKPLRAKVTCSFSSYRKPKEKKKKKSSGGSKPKATGEKAVQPTYEETAGHFKNNTTNEITDKKDCCTTCMPVPQPGN